LRAVAVVAVLLFHFKVPPFSGGFSGVDVFYVITGFLMTQIILGNLDRGRFSLLGFYQARVRRIVPALVVLCLALMAFGLVAIDPLTYQKMAKAALSSLTFLSNFAFAREKGYFTPDAQENWLLHTWSLSVEWQFYLLYPLLLMLLARFKGLRERVGLVLLVAALGSFALSVVLSGMGMVYSRWAFYLLPPRAWEMIAGGLVAARGARLKAPDWARQAMAAVGLVLIGGGVLLLNENLPWPSYWAAIPVLGTALVLLAARADAGWARLPAIQALGLWSYSIYLWHWPVVVALRYFHLADGWIAVALGIAASVALGWLSYELVETRLRDTLFSLKKVRLAPIAGLVAGVAAFSFLASTSIGFEQARAAPAVRASLVEYRHAMKDWTAESVCASREEHVDGLTLCRFGDPAVHDVLVIGDSHAQQIIPRYGYLFPTATGRGVTFAVQLGCAPLPGVTRARPGYGCEDYLPKVYRLAEEGGYRRVVIMSSWQFYFDAADDGRPGDVLCFADGVNCHQVADWPTYRRDVDRLFARFTDELKTLRAKGIEVVVVGQYPYSTATDPRDAYREAFADASNPDLSFSRRHFEQWSDFSRSRLKAAAAAGGAEFVDPADYLCGPVVCEANDGARYMFKDQSHYRASVVSGPKFSFLDRYLLLDGQAPAQARLAAAASAHPALPAR
jgi:peptidoglycan/LPS O-acetylase OafA/YrhL